jgi:iron complex outermembrane receptor protein
VTRYRHDELDGDEIATSFRNDTTEIELLANHRSVGSLKGSFGASVLTRGFDTAGAESLSPAVDQKGYAAFLYEEVTANPHLTFQFGGRVEHAGFTPAEVEPARDFTNFSGSLGLLVHPSDTTTFALSVARAARNPALEELYFHGPHAGNFAFENGNPDLQSERAMGFDASFRWRGARTSGELTYFLNNIKSFIFREFSGAIEDEFPETFFAAGDARLQGTESHIDLTLTENVAVEGGVDYVRGELTSSNQPLPRMPPLRGRIGLRLQKNAFQAGFDQVFTAKQDRIFSIASPEGPIGETATDGSKLLKLFAAYSFGSGSVSNTITARLDNATNELYRNHLNYLKDLIPEVGRNFKVLYSVRF